MNEMGVFEIIRDYTTVKPCVVRDKPDAHTAWLIVGAQSFCFTDQACESKEDALMACNMLAIAIDKIVAKGNNTHDQEDEIEGESYNERNRI